MDIANLKPSERTIEMLHPATEKPLGIRIGLIAVTDPKMKSLRRQIQDQKNKAAMRGKALKSVETEENQNRLLFGVMTGWEWYNPTGKPGDEGYDAEADATFHKEKPPFTQAKVYAVLNELEWFADQLVKELDDEQAFFPK